MTSQEDMVVLFDAAWCHLMIHDLPGVTTDLTTWADTPSDVTAHGWRAPGDRGHVAVCGHLAGGTSIRVVGGAKWDPPGLGGDLTPGVIVPVDLAVLRRVATLGGAS